MTRENRNRHWPHRFTCFATGRVIATEWFRAGSPDMMEEVSKRAEDWARIEGVEVDVHSGSVMPSGKVGSWDRMGLRARPVSS